MNVELFRPSSYFLEQRSQNFLGNTSCLTPLVLRLFNFAELLVVLSGEGIKLFSQNFLVVFLIY